MTIPRSSRRLAVLASGLALLGLVSFGSALQGSGPAEAQESTEQIATVSVSGTGSISTAPDTATVTVGIDVIDADLGVAQSKASEQAKGIIDTLKGLGVDPKDIMTANYSVNIMRDYSEGGDPTRITGFEVTNQVLVTIRKIDTLGNLLDGVVSAGANSIYGVGFYVDDPTPFQAEARKLAVQNATITAQQLAEAAGLKLGRVLSISEGMSSYNPGPMYGRGGGGAEMAMDVPIETGSSEISTTVSMVFELES